MEGITRIVSESLARHGFDRPLDYRRLHWSRWFRCESHHSLLVVPSKPGVFAVAEEIVGFASEKEVEGRTPPSALPSATPAQRRMLAVTRFFADDDMAYVLDRMLSTENPMRNRLASGNYFIRYVVIEEDAQRRSICSALNQWIAGSGDKASGIGAHFATSLELTETRVVASWPAKDSVPAKTSSPAKESPATAPQLDSGAAANLHCPAPFPSGF